MSPQLSWIGLGNMGRGMAKNLVEKGNLSEPLIIYNRTTSRTEQLHSQLPHTKIAHEIQDAIDPADIIFVCLGDDAAVQTTVDTILRSSTIKGKLIVDCSTIHPDSTTAISNSLTEAGAHFVAMPVFGAPAMADAGQLVCVLAGPSNQTARLKPYCKGVMARAEIDFSDQPASKATLLKIIGNTFILSMVHTLSDGHVAAEKTGLGTEELHQFVEVMFPGPFTSYSNRLRGGDYFRRDEPLFAVDLARKDARHAQALANRVGVNMDIVQSADRYLQGVKEHMGAKGDIAGIYGAKRKESGLKFENQD